MNLKEHLEKNALYYYLGILFTGFIAGIVMCHSYLSYTNQTTIHKGTFKTNDEINREYVPIEKYQIQKEQQENYQSKYFELHAKYIKSVSSEPMLAIQIDGPGYKTIKDKIAVWRSSVLESNSSVFDNTDIYKFNDYYYIFKYDKSKNRSELEADIQFIHLKNPDLQCEIIDLKIHCPSQIFVEAEDFNCGNDVYICKTCN